jgi:YD repeat-containing protein
MWCGLVVLVAGCEPLPITAVPPNARWRPELACRVRKNTGPVSGSYYEYQLARDGRAIEVQYESGTVHSRDVFVHDDTGRLLRRERSGSAEDSPTYQVLAQSWRETIAYGYDASGRRTSKERRRVQVREDRYEDGTRATRVESWTRWQYLYAGDRLAAVEWIDSSDKRPEAWRLVYDGDRLVQTRHEVEGRVTFLHEFKYDNSGRRVEQVSVTASGGLPTTHELRYDQAGRLIARDGVSGFCTSTSQRYPQDSLEYDAAGRVVRHVYREFQTDYAYDDKGRIVRIEHKGGRPEDHSLSEHVYSDGCTAAITRALVPDPVNYVLDDLFANDDERWLRVHPDWEWEPIWF